MTHRLVGNSFACAVQSMPGTRTAYSTANRSWADLGVTQRKLRKTYLQYSPQREGNSDILLYTLWGKTHRIPGCLLYRCREHMSCGWSTSFSSKRNRIGLASPMCAW